MNERRSKMKEKLHEKAMETLQAVVPILLIVLTLCFTIAPMEPGILLAFLVGAVLLIVGMIGFTFGVDLAMSPIGESVGTCMTQTRKLWLMVLLTFILGFIVTISEPDLQVLAEQVPSIPNMILVLSVAFGVGIFLVAALLRMLFGITLAHMLIVLYLAVFVLAFFVPGDYVAVAFDSGGVTTGPMTVPFIMALGIGISAIRNDERAEDDSFGLVALSSVGPVLSVLVLGLIYHSESASYTAQPIPEIANSVEMGKLFAVELPRYMKEIAVSILPIILFFVVFQLIFRRMKRRMLIKIAAGMAYTYIGLVLFLTGVNVGFMPAGNYLGQVIAGNPYRWIIISHRYADRIFYCAGGAGGYGADPSGRGDNFRSHQRAGHEPEPLGGYGSLAGAGDDPGPDGDFHFLLPDSRLCAGSGPDLFCSENIYRDRL